MFANIVSRYFFKLDGIYETMLLRFVKRYAIIRLCGKEIGNYVNLLFINVQVGYFSAVILRVNYTFNLHRKNVLLFTRLQLCQVKMT